MKKKNRILALLLTAVMLLGMLPGAAFATEGTPPVSEPGVSDSVDVPQPPAGDENADNENADAALPQPPAGDEGANNTATFLSGDIALLADATVTDPTKLTDALTAGGTVTYNGTGEALISGTKVSPYNATASLVVNAGSVKLGDQSNIIGANTNNYTWGTLLKLTGNVTVRSGGSFCLYQGAAVHGTITLEEGYNWAEFRDYSQQTSESFKVYGGTLHVSKGAKMQTIDLYPTGADKTMPMVSYLYRKTGLTGGTLQPLTLKVGETDINKGFALIDVTYLTDEGDDSFTVDKAVTAITTTGADKFFTLDSTTTNAGYRMYLRKFNGTAPIADPNQFWAAPAAEVPGNWNPSNTNSYPITIGDKTGYIYGGLAIFEGGLPADGTYSAIVTKDGKTYASSPELTVANGKLTIPSDSTLSVALADVYVESDGADTNAGLSNSPLKTLAVAYARVTDGGTIHVKDNLTQAATVTMNAVKNITILSDDNDVATTNDNFIIKRESGFAAPVLRIAGAGDITLENITLDGQGGSVTATSPLILVTNKDGAVTLGDGAVLQNAKSTEGIAGIYLDGAGKLTIAGGTIRYCEATGAIEKSSASAVYVRGSDTEFYMTSGNIINNSGAAYAALTFYKNTKSADKYVISGGTIRDNVTTLADGTGGILSDTSGQVTITGGTISNNIGPKAGGLCFWRDSSKLYLGTGSNITIEGNKKSDPTNVDKQVPNNLFLNQNTVFITINSPLNDASSIGVSTGAIPTVTPGTGDVKIATGAVSGDAKYFLSDNATNAGVLFCDGTNDWTNGVQMATNSEGHTHAAGTLWLSVAAKTLVTPSVTEGACTITVDPTISDFDYAVKDSTGVVVSGDWVKGTGDAMTFTVTGGTSPYQVVRRASEDTGDTTGLPIGGNAHFLYVSKDGSDIDGTGEGQGNGSKAKPYVTIGKAYLKIPDGETGCVILLSDVTFTTANPKPGSTVVVTSEGKAHTMKRTGSSSSSTMTLSNCTVIFDNVILDGGKDTEIDINSFGEVFVSEGSTFILRNGAKIVNAKNRAVNVRADATFIMEGGEISGNVASTNAKYNGDGYGGELAQANAGGGVFICGKGKGTKAGTFIMTGGTITGNTAINGAAGVYGETGTTIQISGSANVTGNINNKDGGNAPSDIYLRNGQTIALSGLTINAKIGVYTEIPPSTTADTGDVKIATGAAKTDAQYFFSDNAATAGVLFCDGAHDWVRGKQMATDSAGHVHAGNANTLWLSVMAASIDAPTVEVVSVTGVNIGNLSENLTAQMKITNYNATGVKYYYSVNGGAKAEIPTPAVDAPNATFPLSGLKYGDNVQVWVENTTTLAVGSKATAKILDTALRNGGFENSTYAWRTTASDKAIEINPHGVYRVPVVEGRYCAELNANIASSLYQEIKTTSGETFTRALQHAGRMGTDVMALIIGPASADGSYGTATKAGDKDFFQTLVAGMSEKTAGNTYDVIVDGKTYKVTIISDGKGAWKNYPGEYVIPANQPATVFAFTSVQTATGNHGLGNLLDGVSFSSLPLEVNARLDSTTGHGQIEVKAVVGGKYTLKDADGTALTTADFAKFGITIKDKNGNVITPADDYTCSEENKDTAPWTFDVPAGSKYQVGVHYASTNTGIDREVTIPGVGGNLTGGITGESPNETATIIVDPADPRLKYGIVDENGNPVAAPNDGWKTVTDGKVVFEGLDPNTKYKVVTTTVADPKPAPKDVTITTEVTTPTEPLPPIDPGKTIITRDPDEDTEHGGNDKITLKPVNSDLDYGVYDPETGDTIWLSGKDKNNGGDATDDTLVFHPLVPGREYEIVTRYPGDATKDPSVPGPSITVPGSQTADPDKVKPGVTEDGKSSIKVFPTDPSTKYAVVDKNTGKVVSPITGDTDGWLTGDPTNPLVFAPLTPGGDYVVVTQPKNPADPEGPGEGGTGTGIYPTTDPAPIGPSITIPGVKLPGQVTAQPDPDHSGKIAITIQPSDPDLIYAVTDKDGNVVGGAGGWQEGKGKAPALTFPGLDPTENYVVVTLPKGTNPKPPKVTIGTGDETGKVTVPDTNPVITGTGTGIVTPPITLDPIVPGGVGRIPGTGVNEGKDKIIIDPTTPGTEYGIIDPISGDEKWIPSTGSAITFQPLDPNKEYQVTTRIPGTPPSLITPPVTVPVITVKPGVTEEGKGSITVNPTDKNTKYALVDAAGKVQVLDPEKDKDGWLTGTGGTLTFAPTVIGKKYQVITLPVDADKDTDATVPGNVENTVYPDKLVPTDGKTKPNPIGPAITAPDVTEEQIKGEIVPGTPKSTATITIQPSDPDLKYAVVDESGKVIGGAEGWQIGTGKGGAALEFKPLDPNTKYFVVTVDKDTTTTDKVTMPDGAGIKTPTDPAGDPNLTIDPDAIDRVHIATGPDAGKDKITVPNPGDSYEVSVIDPATGKVVAPIKGSTSGWIPGESGGGDLTFQPLDPNKGYEVVIRPTDPNNLVVPVRPGVTVPTISTGGNGGGGGGGGGTTGVTVPKRPGGGTTISPTNPKPGEDVIITINPDKGYVLDKLTVKDPKGNELTVTPMGGGKYKVTMPDPAVKLTVDATFKKLSNDPKANGVSDLLNVDDHIAYMRGREGGVFAPGENMTRAEVAQMFYNLLKTQNTDLGGKASYNDVSADAWYAKAVNTLANIGIVNGVGGGSFAPERTITRAEFIAIAARFADVATGGNTFSDVPATHWAFAEITTATAYGWIEGYVDGSFKPGNNIARSEAVKVVNAMLSRSADKSFVDAAKELVTFPDVPKTDWAYYPIMEATNAHDFTAKDGAEIWAAK